MAAREPRAGRDTLPDDDEAREPVERLRELRPTVDRVAMEAVRARAERALFGAAEPARLGRFVLLEPIAGGGMGMVYAAYDGKLDRRVALKVLHPRLHGAERARARLTAEARVLARLDHPNVVPVHDVIELDDQIVIVMELVEGPTLAEWERAQPRSWREIVQHYVAAGRGLEAAHALGLVHRDFKPSNAIVGNDGRVRVLDFGLARASDERAHEPREVRAASLGMSLTGTGEVVGTLGYASPEQLAGAHVDALSDQFSFCVALHRALHGLSPFSGDDAASRLASIRAGRISHTDRRRVPGWLVRVVDRGLAAEPAARHPSMRVLLDELERDPGGRRRRVVVVAMFVGATALATAALVRERTPGAEASCDGGVADLARVWNPSRRASIVSAIERVGVPLATELGARVTAGLDQFREQWTTMHRDACVAHRRGEQSASLLDQRMLCLRGRLADLEATVEVLTRVDGETIDRALEAVAEMPAVRACGDLEALTAAVPPPADDAKRQQVATVRGQLSRAGALERAGRAQEALDEARAARAAAVPIGYPPLIAEAALLEGKVLLFRRELAQAIAPLRVAEEVAFEHGMLPLAVTAAARRLYAEGSTGASLESLVRELAVIEPLSRGLSGHHVARPLLLNNAGVVYMAQGKRDEARTYFERARAALAGVAEPDLELTSIDRNLAMVTSDATVRSELARAAWERLRDALGPQHLSTIEALYMYGHYVADPVVSLPLVREACDLYASWHPDLTDLRADCGTYQAFLMELLGDAEGAARTYDEVAALARHSADPTARSWGQLAAGHASLYRQRPDDALALFHAVIDELSGGEAGWWESQRVGYARIGAGLAQVALGRTREGAEQLEAAVPILISMAAINEDVENHQRLALVRLSLAELLTSQRATSSRGRELASQGRAYLRGASATLDPECHPWLSLTRMSPRRPRDQCNTGG